ncbi:MAG: hypothetical protein BI182_15000 [Acetobacterium sp. MES1]|nr:MAG: hypothetical protein BI182_15000 [Acetobacterium sp. MES1]
MMNIQTIGVIGAGQMGAGIAQAVATGGYRVILYDIKEEYCENAKEKIYASLKKRAEAGKITTDLVENTIEKINTTEDLKQLGICDMVIEAVPEVLELKQSIFKELGTICRPDAILCTNTSTISVSQVMSECTMKERCAGMHFFFPAPVMKLVEVIRSNDTTDATVSVIKQVASYIGKIAIECKFDTPGFIVNRCLFAFLQEALHCYEDGIATIEDIDTAMKQGLNHPMGPFEMMDMSGLDIYPHACESLRELPVTTWECCDSVKKLIEEGRLGRKSGHGWYDYK